VLHEGVPEVLLPADSAPQQAAGNGERHTSTCVMAGWRVGCMAPGGVGGVVWWAVFPAVPANGTGSAAQSGPGELMSQGHRESKLPTLPQTFVWGVDMEVVGSAGPRGFRKGQMRSCRGGRDGGLQRLAGALE
jgi:hypothetical protein